MATEVGGPGKLGLSIVVPRTIKIKDTSLIIPRTITTGLPSGGGSTGPVRPASGQLYPRGV